LTRDPRVSFRMHIPAPRVRALVDRGATRRYRDHRRTGRFAPAILRRRPSRTLDVDDIPITNQAATRTAAPAPVLLVGAMVAFQVGAAAGVELLPTLGTLGSAFWRNAIAAVVLLVVVRPRVHDPTPSKIATVVAVGATIAAMNVTFYAAVARIPLGAAVTISFLGPLTVALLGSRRARDLLWVALAAAGVLLFGGLPGGASLNPAGIVFACLDGCCWGLYAILAKRLSHSVPGMNGLAIAMTVCSLLLLAPAAAVGETRPLGAVSVGLVLTMGLLTALPYALEFAALRRMRAATYGVFVSLEPAIAVVVGVTLLGQHLRLPEAVAVALVVAASLGAAHAGAAVAADVGEPNG
jgi:inner membrane transporter RhtA